LVCGQANKALFIKNLFAEKGLLQMKVKIKQGNESIQMNHEQSFVTNIEKRTITLKCSCGWEGNLRVEGGADSRYADNNLWKNHFDKSRKDF
jgi:hypothetical protein